MEELPTDLDSLRRLIGETSRKLMHTDDEKEQARLYELYSRAYAEYSMRCGEMGVRNAF